MHRQLIEKKEVTEGDIYAFQLPQPHQAIVQHLRTFIADKYPQLIEALKWHVPVYSLNGTTYLLGIQSFKKHVNLNFFKGVGLHDTAHILTGTGKDVRHVTFRAVSDIDESALQELIDQTIANAQR